MAAEEEVYYYYDDNSTLNESIQVGMCHGSNLHNSNVFLPMLYYVIFFTGFLGNLFVITVVGSKRKRSARLVDTFVVNLAVADLVFVLTLPLWAISASQNNVWNFGEAGNLLCKLSSYIIAVNRFSNIFFLTCMSIDRYMAVVNLLDSRYLRSSQCIRITCATVWSISLLLGIPSLLFRRVEDEGDFCVEDTTSVFFKIMGLLLALLTFVFPVLIIVLCYGTLIMHLNKHCVTAGNPRAEVRRRHSLKMVLCIIVAFVVSWLPYNVFKTITIVWELVNPNDECHGPPWQRDGLVLSCCLAYFNSCVNPAIYFFLDQHFRRRAQYMYNNCLSKTKMHHSFNSSASYSNASETFATTAGRSQLQMSL